MLCQSKTGTLLKKKGMLEKNAFLQLLMSLNIKECEIVAEFSVLMSEKIASAQLTCYILAFVIDLFLPSSSWQLYLTLM